MIYMDNAATSLFKPDSVISAVNAAILASANVGRSGHKLSIACLERVYATRKLLTEFFSGDSYDRVIFTKNCTEALNIAILGTLKGGDKVVTTVAEHNSVLRPLHHLKSQGVKVELVGLNSEGELDLKQFARVAGGARAAIVTLASNVNGLAPDIKKIKSLLDEDTLLICDAAQACGHIDIDMKSLGIDALAVAGHKGLLAVQGSGVLIFSERFNPSPISFGGTGSESNNLNMPDYYPDALEAGTLNYPAIVSLAEGILHLEKTMPFDRKNVLKMTEYLHFELGKLPFVKLYSRPNPFGIVAVEIENISSEVAAYDLSEKYRIYTRGGLHCAPLMHEALHSSGLLRISLSFNNTFAECKMVIEAIKKIYRDNN